MAAHFTLGRSSGETFNPLDCLFCQPRSLPAEVTANQFRTSRQPPTTRMCCKYMERNWINSSTWPPSAWSLFRQPVRTNNDVESWHCQLNEKVSHGQLNLYKLVQLLRAEALLVSVNQSLKKIVKKLFVATTKHLRANFSQFCADFSAQFARNLRKLRAILSHFHRNFRANSAQILNFFPHDFLQGLVNVHLLSEGHALHLQRKSFAALHSQLTKY